MELVNYVECVTFDLCFLKLVECWDISHDVERGLCQNNIAMIRRTPQYRNLKLQLPKYRMKN